MLHLFIILIINMSFVISHDKNYNTYILKNNLSFLTLKAKIINNIFETINYKTNF